MGYWDSYQQGAQAGQQMANNILVAPIQRQAALEQLQAERQANAARAIELQKQQMNYQDMLGARNAAASVQGTPEQSVTSVQPPTAQPGQMDPAQALSAVPPSVAALGAPANLAEQTKLAENVQASPEMARMTGADQRLAQMGAPTATPVGDATAFPAQEQPPASPLVQAYNEGRVQTTTTPAQAPTTLMRLIAAQEYAAQSGNFELMEKLDASIKKTAQETGEMKAMGATDIGDYFTKVAKANMGKQQAETLTKGFGVIDKIIDNGGLSALVQFQDQVKQMPGFENFDATKVITDPADRFMSFDAGNGMSVIVDREHPKDFKLEPMTDLSFFVKAYQQEHPKATYAEMQRAYRADKLDQFAAQRSVARTTIVNNPVASRSAGSGQSTTLLPKEYELVSNAIADGRIDAGKVNSRTGKIYANLLRANPGLDLNNSTATASALKQVEKQRSMVETFEMTASKNFDLVERLYDKNPQGTVMLLNKLKNNINTKITGDPETVQLGRALQTALMEYAKVVTGQTGGAAVSDSARKEVESLLSMSDKPETFHGTIANHRLEMRNRMESFQDTVDSLRGGRGGNIRAPKQADTRPIQQYFTQYATKHDQGAMVKELRSKGWSDQQIGQAWAAYKRGK